MPVGSAGGLPCIAVPCLDAQEYISFIIVPTPADHHHRHLPGSMPYLFSRWGHGPAVDVEVPHHHYHCRKQSVFRIGQLRIRIVAFIEHTCLAKGKSRIILHGREPPGGQEWGIGRSSAVAVRKLSIHRAVGIEGIFSRLHEPRNLHQSGRVSEDILKTGQETHLETRAVFPIAAAFCIIPVRAVDAFHRNLVLFYSLLYLFDGYFLVLLVNG